MTEYRVWLCDGWAVQKRCRFLWFSWWRTIADDMDHRENAEYLIEQMRRIEQKAGE